MAIEKIKILRGHVGATTQRALPIQPIFMVNGLDWQCCLAGSSKTAPRIFIFSIVLSAEYLFYVKSIETHARTFLPLNISAIGSVRQAYLKLFNIETLI